MATTSVYLGAADEALLDRLAARWGGRSQAISLALRRLGEDGDRADGLQSFLEEWASQSGPVDEESVTQMAARYGL